MVFKKLKREASQAKLILSDREEILEIMKIFFDAGKTKNLAPLAAKGELRELGKVLVHPLIGWFSLAVVIITWHFPWLYELALHSQRWHQVEHACFFWSAMMP